MIKKKNNNDKNHLNDNSINNSNNVKLNNYSTDNTQGEENKYINYNYINKVKNKENINKNEMIQIDVGKDGNCFMRCMALLIY